MIGGAVRAAEHCGLLEAHARRNGVTIFGARIAELGEGAEPMPAHHPVADLEPGDIGANRDHVADCLAARDEGRLRPKLVFSGQHQDIDILRAPRPDPDLHLAGARRGRLRDLTQGEDLGTTERLAYDRPHPARPYSAASARTGVSCSDRSFSMTSQFVYRVKPFSSKNRTAPVQMNRYVVSSSAIVASCRMPDGS